MPYYYGGDYTLIFLLIGVTILGIFAQINVKNTFNKYSRMRSMRGTRAVDVAQSLLNANMSSVSIVPVSGSLTDHYNPRQNTVGLSQSVYNESSVAAIAVAAHEIGHVMQYQNGYNPIKIRNSILPVARLGSFISPYIVLAGVFMGSYNLAIVGVVLFAAVLVFQLFTLNVEFDASRRALEMLTSGGYLVSSEEERAAKKVLRAAAFTYVVSTLATLVSLLRLLAIASSSRNRR